MSDLQPDSPIRQQAIDDLRGRLEHGLYHYLSDNRNDLAHRSVAELRQIAQEYAKESLHKVLDSIALFRGTSQFITWAARFAARLATADVTCDRCTQLAPEPPNSEIDAVPLKMSDAL